MPDRASDGKMVKGRRLTVLRAARGMEQKDLAQRARVSAGAVSEIEQELRTPEPETEERLLEGLRCSTSAVQRAGWFLRGLPEDSEAPGSPTEAEGRAIEGLSLAVEDLALARVAKRATPGPIEYREALQHWETLKSFPVEGLRRIVEDSAVLQTTAFLEILCVESAKVARKDPQAAAALAELGVDMAVWVPPLAEEQHRPEYRAYSLTFLANALRAQGNLPGAKEAFLESADLWPPGRPANSTLDGSRRLDLWASLLLAERELPQALVLLDQALELGPRGPAARARILIKKAKAHEELKQHAVALQLLEQAEPLLGQEPDPLLVYSHRSILLVNLLALGHAEEAERRLGEVQAMAEELGNDLDRLRLRWFEARIDAALGRPLAAIEKMRQVREDFQERKIPYDTALATLELSALLLEQGQTAEVKQLAEEMLEIFAEQEVPQEAEKALRIFCEAALQETVTLELVRRVLADVERG
jgi:tetratricopeptide (TPR) repeat protein/DNA-binding XRE family transcriptional regulator